MKFEPMHALIPEGSKGVAEIQHVAVDREGCMIASMRGEYVPVGTYVHLLVHGILYMSDTPMEKHSNRDFVVKARGDVLVAGLGIGFAILPVLRKPEVSSVLVVELHQDVIDLVEPHLRVAAGEHANKLQVVCGDIDEFAPARNQAWDVVYFDIWPSITIDNLAQMKVLHRKFSRRKRYWMGSWSHKTLLARVRCKKRQGAKGFRPYPRIM